ncbi:MAG: phosphoribosylaminoimidazolesuccinocarboxamide synthase [Armatimonadetes bacterium]|nr:phosphoribosylaminoimidazolesuccinocarboxamide synthase [Armatimonadota bacterium]
MSRPVVLSTRIPGLKPFATGKVRDVYDLGEPLLIVATDRISAFDVVLPNGIPDKGRVLTQLSAFWFDHTRQICPNHVISADIDDIIRRTGLPGIAEQRDLLDGRTMLVAKTEPIPYECVVRGFLSGSAWKEYKTSGTVCGVPLEAGYVESDKLPQPIFTPSTKAQAGHDENISVDEMRRRMKNDALAFDLVHRSVRIYVQAALHAAQRDIIIADTKFEFGLKDGKLIFIDEALTPDSSRFWDAAVYEPGGSQPSFDKQFVRDYLESIQWNKEPPAPELPEEIVSKTADKYREAYRRITGKDLPR